MVKSILDGLTPDFKGCKFLTLEYAAPMARLAEALAPPPDDCCALWEEGDLTLVMARGAWGVAAAVRHSSAERRASYLLLGASVYCGIASSLRNRSSCARTFHNCDLVAIYHPMFEQTVALRCFERVAYTALAASGLVTEFQQEPPCVDWPGQDRYEAVLQLWNQAQRIVVGPAPKLAAPWPGPLAVVMGRRLERAEPGGRHLWAASGNRAYVRHLADGSCLVEPGSQLLCSGWSRHPSVPELIYHSALTPGDGNCPTVVNQPLGYANVNAMRRLLVGPQVDNARLWNSVMVSAA